MLRVDNHLARLLSPFETDVFFDLYWAKMPLHLSRPLANYADWLAVADLDFFFQSAQLPAVFMNVVSDGVVVPVEEWSRLNASLRAGYRAVDTERLFGHYLAGNTLILNQAQLSVPSLGRACRFLTREFGGKVWTNIYITPPDSKGFARHRDDHEVFILQILGSKIWTVYPNSENPVEMRLSRGDLLYLPRFTEHEARSTAETSIHVTLGVKPTYIFDLIEELAAVAKEHPDFQQPVPLAFSTARAQEDFEREFARKTGDLLTGTSMEALLRRRFQALVKSQPKGWTGRLSDLTRLQNIKLDTVVKARGGVIFSVRQEGRSLVVDFAGKQVRVPVFLKTSLEKITSGLPFAVGELEGLVAEEGKIELVKSFLRAGFLTLEGLAL
jgi:ribosomal protein L16 Arg81 hydroxylase